MEENNKRVICDFDEGMYFNVKYNGKDYGSFCAEKNAQNYLGKLAAYLDVDEREIKIVRSNQYVEQCPCFISETSAESKKNDRLDHKVRMELLPMDALEAVAKIYTFGAEKYGEGKWRQLQDGSERYRAALLRHMTAECKGEELDPESGLPHCFHEAWNALARVAIYLDEHKEETQYIRCGKGSL